MFVIYVLQELKSRLRNIFQVHNNFNIKSNYNLAHSFVTE